MRTEGVKMHIIGFVCEKLLPVLLYFYVHNVFVNPVSLLLVWIKGRGCEMVAAWLLLQMLLQWRAALPSSLGM